MSAPWDGDWNDGADDTQITLPVSWGDAPAATESEPVLDTMDFPKLGETKREPEVVVRAPPSREIEERPVRDSLPRADRPIQRNRSPSPPRQRRDMSPTRGSRSPPPRRRSPSPNWRERGREPARAGSPPRTRYEAGDRAGGRFGDRRDRDDRRDDRFQRGFDRDDRRDRYERRDQYNREDRFERRERRQIPFPEDGPYNAFVGNLSYDVSEDELARVFEDSCKILNARVMRDVRGTSKGYGYVDFGDADSLRTALQMNQTEVMGRSIHVDIAEPRHGGSFGDRRGGGGGGFDRFRRDRSPPRDDDDRRERAQRRPLNLAPRGSADPEELKRLAQPTLTKKKVDPFGGATPRDGTVFDQKIKERREAERREREKQVKEKEKDPKEKDPKPKDRTMPTVQKVDAKVESSNPFDSLRE